MSLLLLQSEFWEIIISKTYEILAGIFQTTSVTWYSGKEIVQQYGFLAQPYNLIDLLN